MSAGVWERLGSLRASSTSALILTAQSLGKRSESKNREFVRQYCCRSWSEDSHHPLGGSRRAELAGQNVCKRRRTKKSAVTCTTRCSRRKIHRKSTSAIFEMMSSEVDEDPSSPGKIRKVIRDQTRDQTTSNSRSEDVVVEEDLYLEGVGHVTASLLRDCLTWHSTDSDDELVGNSCWGRRDSENKLGQLLFSDVYASERCEMSSPTPTSMCGFLCAPLPPMHRFAVYSFQRSRSKKCNWIPKVYIFCHEDADTCQAWVGHIQGLLDLDAHRPKNLLVLVNPYSGKGSGVQQWESVAHLFACARVRTEVIFTERAGHAHDLIAKATEEDLKKRDGVVVVGGDGLFNEVLNGLVMNRHEGHVAPKPQRVAEILAKAPKVDKKLWNEGTDSEEGFQSQASMELKHDPPSGSSFDVHSPLLGNSPYPEIRKSRPMSSNFASNCANSHERQYESRVQQGAVNTALANSASDKEVELSLVDSNDSLPAGTASEADGLQTEEGKFMFPTAAEGVMESSADGTAPTSLAALVRHQSLRKTNVKLRIGIIPAGSTDTIAISTTGSRDPITAALHILLGDSMPLDVVRITGWRKSPQSEDEPPTVRYAASFAGYGFYGDVMKESEKTRWMGPARYDIAGVKVFLKHKKYEAEVSFLELPATVTSSTNNMNVPQSKTICRANCFVCAQGIDLNHLVNVDSEGEEDPVQLRPPKPQWRTTRDSFHSIGAAVMSCRNDKAPDGVAAHAHLADGLLHLILIRSCSRPNYLRQLITLTRKGADPFSFDFVQHYKTPVFTFTSHGEESVWNVDGELFPAHQLSAQCFRGLITLFARGPEH